ncbi:hypothetical protein HDU77_004042 [Chytriomyces hyalinus]|nr:hypothetical protein HDU77_004042 [Chytriomyces hyalinus]
MSSGNVTRSKAAPRRRGTLAQRATGTHTSTSTASSAHTGRDQRCDSPEDDDGMRLDTCFGIDGFDATSRDTGDNHNMNAKRRGLEFKYEIPVAVHEEQTRRSHLRGSRADMSIHAQLLVQESLVDETILHHDESRRDMLRISIEERRARFVRTVTAIGCIVDGKLYKAVASGVEPYFKNRWRMRRAQSYRYIMCSNVLKVLSSTHALMPHRERLCRTLKRLSQTPSQAESCSESCHTAESMNFKHEISAETEISDTTGARDVSDVRQSPADRMRAIWAVALMLQLDEITSAVLQTICDTLPSDNLYARPVASADLARISAAIERAKTRPKAKRVEKVRPEPLSVASAPLIIAPRPQVSTLGMALDRAVSVTALASPPITSTDQPGSPTTPLASSVKFYSSSYPEESLETKGETELPATGSAISSSLPTGHKAIQLQPQHQIKAIYPNDMTPLMIAENVLTRPTPSATADEEYLKLPSLQLDMSEANPSDFLASHNSDLRPCTYGSNLDRRSSQLLGVSGYSNMDMFETFQKSPNFVSETISPPSALTETTAEAAFNFNQSAFRNGNCAAASPEYTQHPMYKSNYPDCQQPPSNSLSNPDAQAARNTTEQKNSPLQKPPSNLTRSCDLDQSALLSTYFSNFTMCKGPAIMSRPLDFGCSQSHANSEACIACANFPPTSSSVYKQDQYSSQPQNDLNSCDLNMLADHPILDRELYLPEECSNPPSGANQLWEELNQRTQFQQHQNQRFIMRRESSNSNASEYSCDSITSSCYDALPFDLLNYMGPSFPSSFMSVFPFDEELNNPDQKLNYQRSMREPQQSLFGRRPSEQLWSQNDAKALLRTVFDDNLSPEWVPPIPSRLHSSGNSMHTFGTNSFEDTEDISFSGLHMGSGIGANDGSSGLHALSFCDRLLTDSRSSLGGCDDGQMFALDAGSA